MSRQVESQSTPGVSEVSAIPRPPTVEVVSDVVCPWCFIGKRRLEKALAILDRQDVTIHWKPFQLNPGAPKEGMDRQAYRIRKFGSLAYSQQLEARVAAAGSAEGIEFRFDEIKWTPNTLEAHRLIWFAGREPGQDRRNAPTVQNIVVENLFSAYFLGGEDVGDTEVLKRIGAGSGLDGGRLDELFAAGLGTGELMAEEIEARARGVTGVPTFFVNGEPIASGAQKPELLAAALVPALGAA
ncbi:MAG TPA: DsbA family oxidoreductase [Bryobacteraceae bacterium]|nr:DsbA family oxidoreductase [Bryobacteraceae bacterium]